MRAVERTLAVGFRMLLVEIVDQDQIEIGARGHLAAAELAHGQHRGLLAAHMAVAWRRNCPRPRGARRGSPRRPAARRLRPPAAPSPCRTGCARRSGTCAPARTCGCVRAGPRRSAIARAPRRAAARAPRRPASAPKKLGSTSASITCGLRASVSASRGAMPSTSAISAIRSGFCRSSDNSRAAPCRLARKWSNSTSAASGFSVRARLLEQHRQQFLRGGCAPPRPCSERCSPASQCRTMLEASSGARKPSAASRSSVLWSSASGGNASAGWSAPGAFSNRRA